MGVDRRRDASVTPLATGVKNNIFGTRPLIACLFAIGYVVSPPAFPDLAVYSARRASVGLMDAARQAGM